MCHPDVFGFSLTRDTKLLCVIMAMELHIKGRAIFSKFSLFIDMFMSFSGLCLVYF